MNESPQEPQDDVDVKPVADGEEYPPLREEDVTLADQLDDRVQEGDGLPRADLRDDG